MFVSKLSFVDEACATAIAALTRPSATLSRKREKDRLQLPMRNQKFASPEKFWFVLLPLAGEGGRRPGEGRDSGCTHFVDEGQPRFSHQNLPDLYLAKSRKTR